MQANQLHQKSRMSQSRGLFICGVQGEPVIRVYAHARSRVSQLEDGFSHGRFRASQLKGYINRQGSGQVNQRGLIVFRGIAICRVQEEAMGTGGVHMLGPGQTSQKGTCRVYDKLIREGGLIHMCESIRGANSH